MATPLTVPEETLREDKQSDKVRTCQTCGTYTKRVWAIWSQPVPMDFQWQCDTCRRDAVLRYR